MKESLQTWLPRPVLAPSFFLILIFVYGLTACTGYLSMTNSKMLPSYDWVGLSNHEKLFRLRHWNTAMKNLAIFGIRPEAFTDPQGADRTTGQIEKRACFVEVVEPAGCDTYAVVNLGGKSAVARLRADAQIAPGAVSELAFNMSKAVFLDPDNETRVR